jgi:uncharacterized membrane protein
MSNAAPKPRTRWAAAAALAAVAAAALSSGAANAETTGDVGTAATCTLATIALPTGTNSSEVRAMSPDGSALTYTAFTAATPNTTRAFVRIGGQTTEVNLPGTNDRFFDVNNSGRAVGVGSNTAGSLAYAWEDGVQTLLSTGPALASGINESGVIVGSTGTPGATTAAYWPAGSTTPVALPVPAGAVYSGATGIGDDGTIIGYVNFGWEYAWLTKPYVWHPDGTYEELTGPTDIGEEESLIAEGVSGDTVVGYVGGLGGTDVGLRWDLATGTYEETALPFVLDVNASGTIAGNNGADAAYETAAGAVTVLPGFNATGYDVAEAVSESGTILAGKVGTGTDSAGRSLFRAATWTCA